MKNEDLKKAMSDIRDEFILEAAPDVPAPKTTPLWRRPWFGTVTGLAAACFVLVLGLGIFSRTRPHLKQSAPSRNDVSVTGSAQQPAAAGENYAAENADMMDAAFEEEMEMEPVPMTESVSEAVSEALTESGSEPEAGSETETENKK